MIPGQDPYFTQYCRINFDGTGLTRLTDADGTHTVTFSADRKYYVDMLAAGGPASAGAASARRRPEGGYGSGQGRRLGAAGRGFPVPRSVRRQGPRRQDGYLGHHYQAHQFRSLQEISGDRKYLRRAAGFFRSEDLQRGFGGPGAGGAGLHRGAHRRHGHQQPLEGFSRCGVEEPGRCRIPGSDPLAQSGGGEISVVRHQPGGHFRNLGGRAEFIGRRAVPPRILQGGGDQQRMPRQPHG